MDGTSAPTQKENTITPEENDKKETDSLPDINLKGPSYLKMTETAKAQRISNQSSIRSSPIKQMIPLQTSPILPLFAIPQSGAGPFRKVNKQAYDKTLDLAFERYEKTLKNNYERVDKEDEDIQNRLTRGYDVEEEQKREIKESTELNNQFLEEQIKLKILQSKQEREIEKVQDPPFDYDSIIEEEKRYKILQQEKLKHDLEDQIIKRDYYKKINKDKAIKEENEILETINNRLKQEKEQRQYAKYQTKLQLRNTWEKQKKLNNLSIQFQKENLGLQPMQ